MKEQTIEKHHEGDYTQSKGKTTIAPEVLLTIAKLTSLTVPGVSRMSTTADGVNRLFNRGYSEGVQIEIRNDVVYADIYIVLHDNINIREVSRQVQQNVSRAITDMVGMQVGRVNIHIEDIDYPTELDPMEAAITP